MSNYTDLLELWLQVDKSILVDNGNPIPVIRTSFEKQAAVDKNTGFHVR